MLVVDLCHECREHGLVVHGVFYARLPTWEEIAEGGAEVPSLVDSPDVS